LGKCVGEEKRKSPHKGISATSPWAAHLIINKVKKSDNRRETKAQDGHTVMAVVDDAMPGADARKFGDGTCRKEGVCAM
jgi:hypothetical protein